MNRVRIAAMGLAAMWSAGAGAQQPQAAPVETAVLVPIRPGAARSVAPLATLFSTDDYPAEAVRNQETGTVSFRVEVDAQGRVSGCAITQSSGSVNLDRATCLIIQRRARFTPGRDRRGKAVSDFSEGRIRWELPSAMIVAGQSIYAFTIDAQRRVGPCAGTSTDPEYQPEKACVDLSKIAEQIVGQAPAAFLIEGKELVFEGAMLVDADYVRPAGTFQDLQRDERRLTFDAAGELTGCEVTASVGMPVEQTAGLCKVKWLMEPLPPGSAPRADRRVTIINAVSLRQP